MLKDNYGNKNLRHTWESLETMVFGDTVVDIIKFELIGREGESGK